MGTLQTQQTKLQNMRKEMPIILYSISIYRSCQLPLLLLLVSPRIWNLSILLRESETTTLQEQASAGMHCLQANDSKVLGCVLR